MLLGVSGAVGFAMKMQSVKSQGIIGHGDSSKYFKNFENHMFVFKISTPIKTTLTFEWRSVYIHIDKTLQADKTFI